MMKVYFAGPDVFRNDYTEIKSEIRSLCLACGLTPLMPGDLVLKTAEDIFMHNLALIDQANAVIANLNPFRGQIEPDSGTVFECAYAYAKGKIVIGYLADRRDLITKIRQASTVPASDGAICPAGTWVENFDLPLNLMLSQSLTAVAGSLKEAVEVAASYKKPGEST